MNSVSCNHISISKRLNGPNAISFGMECIKRILLTKKTKTIPGFEPLALRKEYFSLQQKNQESFREYEYVGKDLLILYPRIFTSTIRFCIHPSTHQPISHLFYCLHGILLLLRTMSTDNQNQNNIRPPQFVAASGPGLSANASSAVQSRGTPSTLNLDDIFGDCFFTPEGEGIFLSENPQLQQQAQQQQQLIQQQQYLQGALLASGEANPTQSASRPTAAPGSYAPVPQAGGIVTTGLHKPNASATAMGTGAAPPAVPFAQAPQRPHHLQYAYVQAGSSSGSAASVAAGAKRGRAPAPAVAQADTQQSKADRT